jgi:hypothetical protein
MPTLSLNEIRSRAITFANEWKNETSEDAEAKSFWDDFFNVFGVPRRRVAGFEVPVKKADSKQGFVDLLWKGTVLVEHKSRGKDLETAYTQAKNYFPGLKDHELPKYIVVSDFFHFKLYDLDESKEYAFTIDKLYENINLFGFISGYNQKKYKDEDPVNIEAAELMGKLHDAFVANGYAGHELEVFLVRILFCLFAEDTAIFEKHQFTEFIEQKTREDGSDLGVQLAFLFQILDTPPEKRVKNLDETLAAFPYINGSLYTEKLNFVSFDSQMREKLLRCCYFDWSKISPAIFGSMFQSVMDKTARRNLGSHYTSEKNILKLIKPLFLDELYREFEKVKNSPTQLNRFHDKIAGLRFLDPACGCGNFLIITYRELRLLEIEILKVQKKGQMSIDTSLISKIDVDAFFGIEYDEFPAQIALVAMWLIDHQMNLRLSLEFGQYFVRLPLKKAANITHGNALRIDWEHIIPKTELSYILGNPPFIGKQLRKKSQEEDMDLVFKGAKGYGNLDYVTGWYLKTAQFIANTEIKAAFVSTNSIAQGEQVGLLWTEMFKYGMKINFAHRTFKWTNEAKGNAAVFVVIIGFCHESQTTENYLYDYPDIKAEPLETKVKNINPYLVGGENILIQARTKPISNVPEMLKGSQPTDDGNFLFTDNEKITFLIKEPTAEKFIKPLMSAREFLHNEKRWCLWLKNASPVELKSLPLVLEKIENVKKFRQKSTKEATRKWANMPTIFTEIRQPESEYILIPRHSSENRKYIPFGFFDKNHIVSDSCISIPNATLFHFGIISSEMHMIWVKYVCGRIKSDFRYSNSIVYNNFPFPQEVTEKQNETVSKLAQAVLDIRAKFSESSLADLYDPRTMPSDLVKAHAALDRAVDACYRSQPFTNEVQRIEYLFDLYKKLTEPLFGSQTKKSRK